MGASPVDPAAAAAAPKVIIILAGKELELLNDFDFGHRLQQFIAVQAAGERRHFGEEIESAQNLDRLLSWILGARMKSGSHNGMHEEAPVPGQEGAPFLKHHFKEIVVVGRPGRYHIESKEPEVLG